MESTDVDVPALVPPTDDLAGAVTSGVEQAADSGKEKRTPPRQKGVPPKRPLTTSKRPTTSTTSSTKVTPPSTGPRSSTISNLNKPPTRPIMGSTARKLPTGTATGPTATGPTAATSLHRTQQSTSSTDENKRPGITGTAKRMSMAPSTTTRTSGTKPISSSTDRRSTITPASTVEKRVVGHATTTSPTKPTRSSLIGTTRSVASATPRSTRPTASATRGATPATLSADAKKKLPTISASPAHRTSAVSVAPVKEEPSETQATPTRPPLGNRRSTKSVMIEQRLREYQAVNEMLQAAMTDAEVENEEKEKIAQKADESMVRLRADLQRARAYEAKHGRMPTEVELAGEPADEEATFETPEANSTILKTQLAESESKVTALQADIEHMQIKMSEFGLAAQEESEKVQTATEAIRAEHTAKIDELVSGHSEELSGLHEKLEAAENMHKEHLEQSSRDLEAAKKLVREQADSKTAELLEEQKTAQTALKKLEQDLDAERKASSTAAAQLAKLDEEIKQHHLRLEEATQKMEQDTKATLESHQNQLQIKDSEIRGNGQVIKNLEEELKDLEASKAQEIEEMKQIASEKANALDAKIAAIQAQLQEAADAKTQTSSEYSKGLAAKTDEIEKLQSVIDSLQNDIRKLYESNSNDLDATTVQLGQEHEKIISKLKEDHESSVKALIDEHHEALSKADANSESLSAEHDKNVGDLLEEHHKALEGFSEKVEDLSAAKKSLEEKIEFMQVAHADELAKERKKIVESELALAEANEASAKSMSVSQEAAEKSISSLQEKIKTLEKQIEEDGELMQSTISSLEDAQRQNESFQKGLDSFKEEALGKDEHHAKTLQKLRAEAAESGKSLEDKTRELASMEQSHQAALKDFEDSHLVELEKMGSELTSKHESAIKELQAKHKELAAANEALSISHAKEIELLESKHSDAINSHIKELDSTRAAHSDDLSTLTKQYEDADAKIKNLEDQAQQKSATGASHEKELESLLEKHEEELASLRQELEDAGAEKSSSLAMAHAAQIAELQGEVHTHKEALVQAEQELHKSTSNQAVDTAKVEEYKAEIESLQQELADSKKTAQSVTEDLKTRLQSKLKADADLQEASKQIADLNAKLAKDQETIAELTGAATEASKVMMDGGKEADQLRAENQELAKKHDTAISQLQQDLKSLTEGKASAEKGETAAKEQLKQALDNLKTAGTAEKDLKDVQAQLQDAIQDSETHKANHQKALQEVEALRADTTSKEVVEKLDGVQQNLMSSNATNAALVQQLQEAEASVEKSTTRVRELEAQLKVVAAELTEAHTKRESGMDFLSSPEGKASPARGLAASQWANADGGEAPDPPQDTVGGAKEGEEIGSSIEGTMASIQEQLRQLGGVNEDMFDENKKVLELVAQASHTASHPTQATATSVTAGNDDSAGEGVD